MLKKVVYFKYQKKERIITMAKVQNIIVGGHCVFCGKGHKVAVPKAGFEAWQNGELIQKALPEASATVREFLISGICPECQASIFGDDDSEED